MHLWFKAFHLISMVAWFAGLFYLFRLLVYQVENRDRPDVVETLRTMTDRLYRIITNPAMIATYVFGIAMLVTTPAYLTRPWMIVKLVLVLGLSGYTGYVGSVRRRFAAGDYFLTPRQCRIRNEIPTLFLIAIVLLAVLRPGG